jgi:hypothetical protein
MYQIYNVGLDNFQIRKLAFLISEILPFDVEVEVAPDDMDKRDYNVSFSKIFEKLNFSPSRSIEFGVNEIYSALKSATVDTGIKTNTVKWYRNILESKVLLDSISLNNRII